MRLTELSITKIGNSRGVRLPAKTLKRYHIEGKVIMEERSDEIVLRPQKRKDKKISWKQTFQEMALEKEHWSDWEITLGDGLDDS